MYTLLNTNLEKELADILEANTIEDYIKEFINATVDMIVVYDIE